MINILIADDHPLILEGLRNILRQEPDINVCCESQDADGVLERLQLHHHDILVTDISMPGTSGIELLKEIKRTLPKLPVLILSMHPEERFAVRSIKAGAAGYLTKEAAPRELVNAVRKIISGGRYITPNVAEKLAAEFETAGEKPPHEYLSDREFQILCLISAGKSLQEIADDLFVSINTIKSYRARLLEKMNLKTNVELTRYAMNNKLID